VFKTACQSAAPVLWTLGVILSFLPRRGNRLQWWWWRIGDLYAIFRICLCQFCGQLCILFSVTIWAYLLKDLQCYKGLKLQGAFPPNFQCPPVAKLYVVCEHVLEVQEWYASPLSLCRVWWGSDYGFHQGQCFLFVILSSDIVSQCFFAAK